MRSITIASLIEDLKKLNKPGMVILVSQDEEGNGFSRMSGYSLARFGPGDIHGQYIEPEDVESVEQANCIIIWPSH